MAFIFYLLVVYYHLIILHGISFFLSFPACTITLLSKYEIEDSKISNDIHCNAYGGIDIISLQFSIKY